MPKISKISLPMSPMRVKCWFVRLCHTLRLIGLGWLPCDILQNPARMTFVLHQPQAVHSPFSSWHAEPAIFCRGALAVFWTLCLIILIYSSLGQLYRTSFRFSPSSKELTPFLWLGWTIFIDAEKRAIFAWFHSTDSMLPFLLWSRAKKSLNSQRGSNSSSQSQWTTPGKWRIWGATFEQHRYCNHL